MEPILIDPDQHAPEGSADGVWEDSGVSPSAQWSTTVLPPKRTTTEAASAAPPGRNSEGLRIELKTNRPYADDSARQLVVQEIDGSVVRLDPEASMTPRVARQSTAFQERPAKIDASHSEHGEGREWGKSRQHSVRWILGTGAGIAAVVIVAMMLLPLINRSDAKRPRAGQTELVLDPNDNVEGIESLNDMLTRQPEAEQLFRAFASASVADEILVLVRDAETVRPLIRMKPRPALISKAWLPPDDTRWEVLENDGKPYGILTGTLPDYSRFAAYMVLAENQLCMDWKASTGYGTATFDELQRNEGDAAEIRATIIPSDFYTATFPESEFQSYQLVSPQDEKTIWCYTRRKEPVDDALTKLFLGGEILKASMEPKKVTLRLEHAPSGALPNQWLVAEMLHDDWITL